LLFFSPEKVSRFWFEMRELLGGGVDKLLNGSRVHSLTLESKAYLLRGNKAIFKTRNGKSENGNRIGEGGIFKSGNL